MEAGTKADQELEKVERQIAQLESVAEGNQVAQKQLRGKSVMGYQPREQRRGPRRVEDLKPRCPPT